jgi:predicted N-formylglutamate amidohydrolase
MLHPSAQAETFIWEKFLETCLFPGERPLLQKVEKLRLQCIHRPLHPNRPEHALAMMKLSEELDQFAATYPHLDVTYLMEMLNQNIKTYA